MLRYLLISRVSRAFNGMSARLMTLRSAFLHGLTLPVLSLDMIMLLGDIMRVLYWVDRLILDLACIMYRCILFYEPLQWVSEY